MMKKMYLLMACAILFNLSAFATSNNPTTLVDLSLEQTTNGVKVVFNTSIETNCSVFLVEKLERNEWIEIHKFRPLGNLTSGSSYSMVDTRVNKNNAYYRISFEDTQGSKHILKSKSIVIEAQIWGDAEVWGEFSSSALINETSLKSGSNAVCELKRLTATKVNGSVELNWVTSSEINCKTFIIQKKEISETWENIGFVNANGSDNTITQYSYTDSNPVGQGQIRYRISVLGIDGDLQILNTVMIKNVNPEDTTSDDSNSESKSLGEPMANINSFNVEQTNNKIKINFTTEFEQNCEYFLVQKSKDRTIWERAAKLKAKGGISETNYFESNNRIVTSDHYFRILAEDKFGNQNEIGATTLNVSGVDDIVAYPNPAFEQLFIQSGNSMENLKITLSDLEGNVLIMKENNFTRSLVLELSELEKGLYILTITDGKKTKTEKILVDR